MMEQVLHLQPSPVRMALRTIIAALLLIYSVQCVTPMDRYKAFL